MTEAEWQVVRTLLPVPAWLEGRGGCPEGYCHRQILDAVRYVVDNGVKWANLPRDFPPFKRVHAFARRWQDQGLLTDEDMEDADGAQWLFDVLIAGSAEAYQEFAEEYYEVTLDLAAVQAVFDLKPLTQEIVSALNPEVALRDLSEDTAQIGYPGTG
jgi:hypothetical protein